MFHSIRAKILVLQLGLMLCVIAALGVSTYMVMSRSLESSQEQNLEYLVREVGKNINASIDNRKELLAKIANSEDVSRYVAKQQEMLLIGQFSKHRSQFPTISYANSNGLEQLRLVDGDVSPQNRSLSDTRLFIEAARRPNTAVCVYAPSDGGYGEPCLSFGLYSVNFFDEFAGFFRALAPVTGMTQDLEQIRIGKTGYILLIDSDGRILCHPEGSGEGGRLILEQDSGSRAYETLCSMESGRGRGLVMGVDSYFVFVPVRGIDWSIVAVVPRAEFAGMLGTLRNTVIFIGIVILVAGGLVMVAVAENITRPIRTLTKTTVSIAQGDFSQRIEVVSNDEIGMLARSFNRMSEELQSTTTSISKLNMEVTERQKAEDALVKANAELEATVERLTGANRELQEFAHITAHDLKTPLRAIGSLAGIIQSDYWEKLDVQGRNYLSLLTDRVERMNHFIRGILRYSEMGRVMDRQIVDMNEVIDEALGGISLPSDHMIIKESSFPTLSCNRAQMTEVFSQLLSNAVRYMDKPTGRITLACEEGEGFWKFSVADNGCGIEEKHLGKIFGIFTTLNRRDEMESIGIGLALVRKIVETYNGKVWVESRPGEGSVFCFSLPAEKIGVEHEKLSANTAG